MDKTYIMNYLNGFIEFNTARGTIWADLNAIFEHMEEYFGYNKDNYDEEIAGVLKTIKGLMDASAIREAEVWHKQAANKKQTAWWIEIMRHEGATL